MASEWQEPRFPNDTPTSPGAKEKRWPDASCSGVPGPGPALRAAVQERLGRGKHKGGACSSTGRKTWRKVPPTNRGHRSLCLSGDSGRDPLQGSPSSQRVGGKSLSLAGGRLLVVPVFWLFFKACSSSEFLTESPRGYLSCPSFLLSFWVRVQHRNLIMALSPVTPFLSSHFF